MFAAQKRVTELGVFFSIPFLQIMLVLLASTTTDVFRVMDCSFLIGIGTLVGWFFFPGARWVRYTVVFVCGSCMVVVAAITTAADPAAVAWAAGTITVLAVVVCVAVGRLRHRDDVLSYTDWLTGALNRRGLERFASTLRSRTRGYARPTTLIAVDIDDFKLVNDTAGHAAGDRLLVEFVAAWKTATRTGDAIGRIGGDEFIILLSAMSSADSRVVLQRVRYTTRIEFSAGFTDIFPGDELGDAIRRADHALYLDKKQRRKG